MGEFSLTHLLLLSIIVLIFFGPSRLPALGQSLGKAIKGFKQGLNEIDAEVKAVEEVKAPNSSQQNAQNQIPTQNSAHAQDGQSTQSHQKDINKV
jgi:sec-independent protein translocase protein TatA